MAGVNKVILLGNLGSDPEVRSLPSGSKVASFSIATSEAYNNKEGVRVEQTEWHRIELWDALANIAEIEYSQVSRIERGLVNTSVSVIFIFAGALEVKPAQLLELEPLIVLNR